MKKLKINVSKSPQTDGIVSCVPAHDHQGEDYVLYELTGEEERSRETAEVAAIRFTKKMK